MFVHMVITNLTTSKIYVSIFIEGINVKHTPDDSIFFLP